jgi:glycosyltransferase involved in cell wall biosynthesis
MIFFANVLTMNGGSTFLIRTCHELFKRNIQSVVLLLRSQTDPLLLIELNKYAHVIHLKEFLIDKGYLFREHIGVFGWIKWSKLKKEILVFDGPIHVMGIFGLIFALRLTRDDQARYITVGIYHQNEFLYSSLPFFFTKEASRLFSLIPSKNIIFFNEATRRNYTHFFKVDYSEATIVPIGIDIKDYDLQQKPRDLQRIVSVGNLVNFKTYNAHMIHMISQLLPELPNLQYAIYGEGPEKLILHALAKELRVEDHVHFMGISSYLEFHNVVSNATLFVGSGTALIEAAALGIPALIGIESIKTPETYGFLSEIEGLNYNEYIADITKKPMLPLIKRIFTDPVYHFSISKACAVKAREFSVTRTVDGLLSLKQSALPTTKYVHRFTQLRMMLSFIRLAIFERLDLVERFSNRRGQSYEVK